MPTITFTIDNTIPGVGPEPDQPEPPAPAPDMAPAEPVLPAGWTQDDDGTTRTASAAARSTSRSVTRRCNHGPSSMSEGGPFCRLWNPRVTGCVQVL